MLPPVTDDKGHPAGLAQVADMMKDAKFAHYIFINYMILQSVNMLMFMLRLVSQVVFQPRLAVLAKTLIAQINDLSHFMLGGWLHKGAMCLLPAPVAAC
jgi:hypothetical protein